MTVSAKLASRSMPTWLAKDWDGQNFSVIGTIVTNLQNYMVQLAIHANDKLQLALPRRECQTGITWISNLTIHSQYNNIMCYSPATESQGCLIFCLQKLHSCKNYVAKISCLQICLNAHEFLTSLVKHTCIQSTSKVQSMSLHPSAIYVDHYV